MTVETIYQDDDGLTASAITDEAGKTKYRVVSGEIITDLNFQCGPVPLVGLNGMQNEVLLAVLIHRTTQLDAIVPCDENKQAIKSMKAALNSFMERTEKRKKRGVEGSMNA